MLILRAENIKKYFSDRLIFEFDGLKVYTGDKIGIVGQNGSGKTTLMNILSGEIEPDEGMVKRYCDVSYIRQFSDEEAEADQRILKEFDISQKTSQKALSGGEKTRIRLANAFDKDNILLFADEPTSNLDYKGIEILRQKLSGVETFMLISHDRFLLDSLCNRIIEIRDGKLKIYNGNYSFYKERSNAEFKRAELEYENYVSERASLEEAIRDRQGHSKTIKKAPSRMGNSEARLHTRSANEKKEKLDNAANSLKTRLEKLEVKEKPKELPKIRLDFSLTNPPENRIVISADRLDFSYGSRRILKDAQFKVLNGSKTAIWGENGAGKTTLLNLIAGKDEGIYTVPKARIGYVKQCFENLEHKKSVLENVTKGSVQSQTTIRTVLARLLICRDDVYKNIEVLSGGERIKVSLAKLFVSDANVLLLDEPTNYLDMQSIEALEGLLLDYEGTVLFVSHDRSFVDAVADRLLIIENSAVTSFDGKLREYESGRNRTDAVVRNETERLLLKMRMTEVISRLSSSGADRDALEAEYNELVARLK